MGIEAASRVADYEGSYRRRAIFVTNQQAQSAGG
jgi:hypothetical protein